jgi:hypothetical protein
MKYGMSTAVIEGLAARFRFGLALDGRPME